MPHNAKIYKVMIASPNDVAKERSIIRDVIYDWNNVHSDKEDVFLWPAGWESHSSPAIGDRPQAIINKQVLADSDLLIAVFWTRIGSPTGKAISGTVEEIEEHVKAGKPAMIYFSSQPVAVGGIDKKQYQAMLKFKEELHARGLIETYDSVPEFREKLARQLAHTVIRYFLPKKKGRRDKEVNGVPSKSPMLPALSPEAALLLTEACQDESGIVFRVRTFTGLILQTNGDNLVKSSDPRTVAQWDAALRELVSKGLLQDRRGNESHFAVTHEGFRVGELVNDTLLHSPSAVLIPPPEGHVRRTVQAQ